MWVRRIVKIGQAQRVPEEAELHDVGNPAVAAEEMTETEDASRDPAAAKWLKLLICKFVGQSTPLQPL